MPGKTIMESRVTLVGNIGDTVTVSIPEDQRSSRHNKFRDGEQVAVVGYASAFRGRTEQNGMKPGEYANYAWPIVRNAEGRKKEIYHAHLERDPDAPAITVARQDLWLRDLPETDFWEGDIVRSPRDEEPVKVLAIAYDWIGQKRQDGRSLTQIYACGASPGAYSYYGPEDLELVARGNVWKIAHGEQPEFADVEEEASFHYALGDYDFIRNPSTDNYAWTEEEALQAVADGLADAFTGRGLLGRSAGSISVIVFNDRDIGERIRAHVMENYHENAAPKL